jgi:hypothetical protein
LWMSLEDMWTCTHQQVYWKPARCRRSEMMTMSPREEVEKVKVVEIM